MGGDPPICQGGKVFVDLGCGFPIGFRYLTTPRVEAFIFHYFLFFILPLAPSAREAASAVPSAEVTEPRNGGSVKTRTRNVGKMLEAFKKPYVPAARGNGKDVVRSGEFVLLDSAWPSLHIASGLAYDTVKRDQANPAGERMFRLVEHEGRLWYAPTGREFFGWANSSWHNTTGIDLTANA